MTESVPVDESLDIAITGMACRLPGAPSIEAFWQVLRDGVECIRTFSDAELVARGVPAATLSSDGFVKAGAVLDDVDRFDAAFFGYSAREAELMDPQHRVFLECGWEALERAGCVPDHRTVGVFAGAGLSTYLLFNLLTRPDLSHAIDSFQTMIGNDKDFLATRLSYLLDLRGPSLTVQTGCSTSLVAVHLACQSLLGYHCDVALAGGAAIQVPQRTGYHHLPGGIASPDGHCRPFDADAAGTIFGSGVGVVVLKRLADALADRDHIHAVIKGSAINNDGSTKLGYTAPSVDGQVEVITRAQAMAQVSPEAIGFIEAHGTGTALGDPVEVEALSRVFGAAATARAVCALGSVKSNLGHLDAAAGVTGLIKAALAVERGELPPTLHIQRPNPIIAWDRSPFFVNAALEPWRITGRRRAGVSSFGIGGTNAHAVLEEPPPPPPSGPSRPHQVLVVSARTRTALDQVTAGLARHLDHDLRHHPEQPIADVAYSLQVGRRALPYRRAVVCSDAADAIRALAELPPQRSATPAGKAERRRVVFMFPGGGAQHSRMGRALHDHEPVFRDHLDACAARLAPRLGVDLRDVIYPAATDGHEPLTRTSLALPALFAVEYAMARLWMSWGVEPDAMIGHSVGEYVAACLAGVFSLDDALALVAERGRLFEIAPRGGMLNVELAAAEVRALCGDRLSIAAVNGPDQCVVAGDQPAIEDFAAELAARGATARKVHIDVAAHSHLIEPIMPAFAALLGTLRLRAPERPFLSCVTGGWITAGEATSVEYWVRHLRQTVQFGAGVQALAGSAGAVFLEVGPGRTLSSLVRQQLPAGSDALVVASMRSPLEDRADTEVVMTALGRLWAAGVEVDFARGCAHEQRRRVILPTYPWERRRFWLDPQAAAPAAPQRPERNPLADWFYLPSWRAALPAAPVSAPMRCLVFVDAGPDAIGAPLAALLASHGHQVTTVAPGAGLRQVGIGAYEIDPRVDDACTALLAELVRARRRPDRIVYLWTQLAPPPDSDPIEHARLFGLDVLISLGQAIGAAIDRDPVHVAVIASGVEIVSGRETLRPERALALGPCRVLPIELSNATTVLIDVEDGPLGEAELLRLTAEIERDIECEVNALPAGSVVALRGARRWVQAFDPVRLDAPGTPRFRQRGVYLITGGLGGIGLVLAEHLARHAQARLALLARSELPERAAWPAWLATRPEDDPTAARIRQITALEALGAEVLVLCGDVADPSCVESAVHRIRAQFGALHGVIHAAGVPSGGLIQLKDRAAIGRVLRPKLAGTLVLDRAVAHEALDFFVVCSSRTATTGDLGQVDHAAANAFLEAFAERRTQDGRTGVVALAWDTWAEVGQAVTTAIAGGTPGMVEAVRARLLAHAIRPAEGAEVLERVLACGAPRVVVSTRPLEIAAADSRQLGRDVLAMAGLSGDTAGLAAATTARGTAPTSGPELERAIARIWSRVLRVDHVAAHDSFFDLGGNSVIALRLVSELQRELGVALPVAALFESPTIAALAQRLAGDGGAHDAIDEAIEDRRSRGARRRARHHRQDAK